MQRALAAPYATVTRRRTQHTRSPAPRARATQLLHIASVFVALALICTQSEAVAGHDSSIVGDQCPVPLTIIPSVWSERSCSIDERGTTLLQDRTRVWSSFASASACNVHEEVPSQVCNWTPESELERLGADRVLQRQIDAVHALIERLVPEHSSKFVLEAIEAEGYGVFEIDSDIENEKVILRGSSGVELASALNWYLKDYCNAMVSWTGNQLDLPEPLPLPQSRRRTARTMKYSYYQNTCTSSYSFAFYDWAAWEKHIDWMALSGINFPLAFTGQEYIFARTYEKFGVAFEDLVDFFAGPAFQAWQRMGNLNGWGGPQSRAFVQAQRDLQLKILSRMRSFGMTPILTSFNGVVPDKLRELHPNSKFTKSGWGSTLQYQFKNTHLLHHSDPLFLEIGSTFIEIQREVYGTNHVYNTDTFNENTPPSSEPGFLRASANAVYESMRRADEDAVWVMQGWLFHFAKSFWGTEQVKGLLSGVPDDKMIILDMFTDSYPVWNEHRSYYGKPFIWCLLHNFGGSIGMYGRTDVISTKPLEDFNDPSSTMIGIGLTMEGIDQNYILYDLMLEQAYRTSETNMTTWTADGVGSWVARRYGSAVLANATAFKSLATAWQQLQGSVYSHSRMFQYSSSISRLPTLDNVQLDESDNVVRRLYDSPGVHRTHQPAIYAAWKQFVTAAEVGGGLLKESETFRYDLVDISRQALSEVFREWRFALSISHKQNDAKEVRGYGHHMLTLIDDMDELLCTESKFLLGAWLQAARRTAPPGEEDNFEFNARNQVTLWGPKLPLLDYATKEWCGLTGVYFKRRYSEFIDGVADAIERGTPFSQGAFNGKIAQWTLEWNRETDPKGETFPDTTRGDAVEVSLRLFKKYYPLVKPNAEKGSASETSAAAGGPAGIYDGMVH